MSNRKHDINLVKVKVHPEARVKALRLITKLEDIQGNNDDMMEQIAKQTDAIEEVIQELLRSGIIH